MQRNTQPSTFNFQRPTMARGAGLFGSWTLKVEGSAFLLLTLLAAPLLAQSPTNALLQLAPAYGEMRPGFWELHGTAVLVGSFVFVALAGAVAWFSSRPKPPVAVAPEVLARNALSKLLQQPEDGRVLSETSQILRRYLMAAFAFPSGEWTTREFCAALAHSEEVGGELAQAVAAFLCECDERKFSPANPPGPLQAANRALELVAQAEQCRALRRAPAPGATAPPAHGAPQRTPASQPPDAGASGQGRAA